MVCTAGKTINSQAASGKAKCIPRTKSNTEQLTPAINSHQLQSLTDIEMHISQPI